MSNENDQAATSTQGTAASTEHAKRTRKSLRTKATRLNNEIGQLTATTANLTVVLQYELKIRTVIHELTATDRLISQSITDNEIHERDFEEADRYQDALIDSQAKLMGLKERLERTSSTATTINETSTRNVVEVRTASAEIKLPSFDGDLMKWSQFWELFELNVHKKSHIGNVEKFSRLKTLLRGQAADCLSGIPVTAVNYGDAVEMLRSRFGQPELLRQEHMSQLLNTPKVASTRCINDMRRLLDHVERHTRCLRGLSVEEVSYGDMLYSVLCSAIPKELLLEYHRGNKSFEAAHALSSAASTSAASTSTVSASATSDDTELVTSSKLSSLLEYLRREVQTRELTDQLARTTTNETQSSSSTQQRNLRHNKGAHYKPVNYSSAHALNVHARDNTNSNTKRCLFCKRNHETSNCTANVSIDEKKRLLRSDNRCYRCTKVNHSSRACPSRGRLVCAECKGSHVTTMCEPKWHERGQNKDSVTENTVAQNSVSDVVGVLTEANSACAVKPNATRVLMHTAMCYAENARGERVMVRILFDNGSQRSFVTEQVVRKLDLPILSNETLAVGTFGSTNAPLPKEYNRVRLWLRSRHDRQERAIDLLVTKSICSSKLELPALLATEFDFITEPLADVTDAQAEQVPSISVLIGCDSYWQFVTGQTKKLSESLVATKLIFGWSVMGPYENDGTEAGVNPVTCSVISAHELNDQARRMWDLEAIGINERTTDQDPSEFTEEFTKNISRLSDGRYTVRLPLKEHIELDNNSAVAKARLIRLMSSLVRNNALETYNNAVQEYVLNGHAERVNYRTEAERLHYLPHRGVIKRDRETTKTRVVFDASAHLPGSKSLNDNLYTGPHLFPDVLTVLLNFRTHPVAVQADIEKAFLQIAVDPRDTDVLRFYWYDLDTAGNLLLDQPVIYRMTRLIFGATCSPFILGAVIRKHLQTSTASIADILRRDLYVDDLITGATTATEIATIRTEATGLMNDAKFPLKKWVTNDQALMSTWVEESPDSTREIGIATKVLGIFWQTLPDTLSIDTASVRQVDVSKSSKRTILSVIARIFDPLGIVTPFVVQAKVLFQQLWVAGLDWDQPLSEEHLNEWTSFTNHLLLLDSIKLPRFPFHNDIDYANGELHVFVDASERAYGAVVYERRVKDDTTTNVFFVVSKSRVAPLKRLTIPRLELMAALTGSRLCDYLKRHVDQYQGYSTHFWSDSMDTLAWIRGDVSRWKPFVANRVEEIQRLTTPASWSHCPGCENPADLLTRGVGLDHLMKRNEWFAGPQWLTKSSANWPAQPTPARSKEADEEKKTAVLYVVPTVAPPVSAQLIDFSRFSDFERLKRSLAIWLRFINHRTNEQRALNLHPITVEELGRAEICLIRLSQRQCYPDVFSDLKRTGEGSTMIKDLRVFRDNDGCLRVITRLQESDLSTTAKLPYLVSPDSPLATLLIRRSHEQTLHGSVGDTLCQLRESIFVPRARSKVKSLLHRCVVCQRFNVRPPQVQFAPLPSDRAMESTAFDVTGIDFAGPLYIIDGADTRKVYVALFTCATSRAIHLEMVASLNVEDFIMALRRFCSRRGVPRVIWSDNARTFKRASKELYQLFRRAQHEQVRRFTDRHNITWKFIVERAPWHGGFWERLVRSVKLSLKKTLGTALVTGEVMRTLLCEVEGILNSRPLTYASNDADDLRPLTPADLLVGRRLTALPTAANADETEPVITDIRRLWKKRQQLVASFWRRWTNEYLTELRTANRNPSTGADSVFKKGDLVLLKDAQQPRQNWKLGRVQEIFAGRDGKVRSASVRVSSGKSTIIVRRPIQLLCRLELAE